MAKTKVAFICRSCGAVHPKWYGKCPDCGEWDALEEHRTSAAQARDAHKGLAEGWGPVGVGGQIEPPRAARLTEIDEGRDPGGRRIVSGIGELDRVLGGGLVAGSAVLVGGDPGIGKSTLLLQMAGAMASRSVRTLYVTSEESAEQVKLRASRLRGAQESGEELWVLADTNLARIVEQVRTLAPAVVVIDSIQMIYKADLDASPGSATQLRRCCMELVYLAKAAGVAVVMVGHVTKEGALAGPRLLEHLVDAVLYFEGDRHHQGRIVRAVKNRFGATLEIGLFEMGDGGLREMADGLSARAGEERRAGSVACPAIGGSRCLMVEVQALTATGFLGSAKRRASGLDASRLAMLIAGLEQHAGMRLADRDVFASVVGGVRVVEPAADLALALAIAGAERRRAVGGGVCVFGEVGLGGEVRPVSQHEARVREAQRLGYRAVVCGDGPGAKGIEVVRVRSVGEALEQLA